MTKITRVAEEVIRPFGEFNNGAGPMWCFGSRTIVRDGDSVFASAVDADPAAKPLCNARWYLYRRRDGDAWRLLRSQEKAGEREPCPIALQPGGQVIMSVNTAVARAWECQDGRAGFSCEPHLLVFDAASPSAAPAPLAPWWAADYACFEHSYRGFAAEPAGGLFLTQQVKDEGYDQGWCYRDASGAWAANGVLRFPMRGCYPAIALAGKAVHVVAISDEIEPNETWRAHKKEVTGRDWDYDFRQLFYTWTPEVLATPFSPTLTIGSTDETCGHILHTDVYVDAAGDAHVLYIERNIWHAFMRDRFFPKLPVSVALKYARVRKGRIVERQTLVASAEDLRRRKQGGEPVMKAPVPTWAAFHPTPDGSLFLSWHQAGANPRSTGNYIRRFLPRRDERPVKLPLRHPLSPYFTNSPRAGCAPSDIIDLYGTSAGEQAIRYAQMRLA